MKVLVIKWLMTVHIILYTFINYFNHEIGEMFISIKIQDEYL